MNILRARSRPALVIAAATPPPQVATAQRHGKVFALFCLWLLSIPLARYSLVSTYSFDNLMAPLLCLAVIAVPQLRFENVTTQRMRTVGTLVTYYALFTLAGLLPVLSSTDLVVGRTWSSIRDAFYFVVPALFIRDRWSFNAAKSMLIIVAMIGGTSALLDSLGIIHLTVQRYENSRIGVEWLPKAIGFFSAYGDVAILYGFATVVVISHERKELLFGLGTRLGKALFWLSMFAGILGSQSRNMIIATGFAVTSYLVLGKLSKAHGSARAAVLGAATVLFLTLVAVFIILGGDVAHILSRWGGKGAYETAHWRLETYQQALQLIGQHPVMGLSTDLMNTWGALADHLHNMWLRVMLQGGILRLLPLLAIIWLAAKGGVRALNDESAARDAKLVVCTVIAMCIATEFYGGLTHVVWLMIGVLTSFWWVRGDPAYRAAQ